MDSDDDTCHSNSHRSGSVIRTPQNHHSRHADKKSNHGSKPSKSTYNTSHSDSDYRDSGYESDEEYHHRNIKSQQKKILKKQKDFASNKYAQSSSSFSQSSSFNSTTSPSTLKTVNNSEASQSTTVDGSDALQNSDISSDETATHSSKHSQFRFKRVAGRVATPALVNDVHSSSNLSSTHSFSKRPPKASTPFQHKKLSLNMDSDSDSGFDIGKNYFGANLKKALCKVDTKFLSSESEDEALDAFNPDELEKSLDFRYPPNPAKEGCSVTPGTTHPYGPLSASASASFRVTYPGSNPNPNAPLSFQNTETESPAKTEIVVSPLGISYTKNELPENDEILLSAAKAYESIHPPTDSKLSSISFDQPKPNLALPNPKINVRYGKSNSLKESNNLKLLSKDSVDKYRAQLPEETPTDYVLYILDQFDIDLTHPRVDSSCCEVLTKLKDTEPQALMTVINNEIESVGGRKSKNGKRIRKVLCEALGEDWERLKSKKTDEYSRLARTASEKHHQDKIDRLKVHSEKAAKKNSQKVLESIKSAEKELKKKRSTRRFSSFDMKRATSADSWTTTDSDESGDDCVDEQGIRGTLRRTFSKFATINNVSRLKHSGSTLVKGKRAEFSKKDECEDSDCLTNSLDSDETVVSDATLSPRVESFDAECNAKKDAIEFISVEVSTEPKEYGSAESFTELRDVINSQDIPFDLGDYSSFETESVEEMNSDPKPVKQEKAKITKHLSLNFENNSGSPFDAGSFLDSYHIEYPLSAPISGQDSNSLNDLTRKEQVSGPKSSSGFDNSVMSFVAFPENREALKKNDLAELSRQESKKTRSRTAKDSAIHNLCEKDMQETITKLGSSHGKRRSSKESLDDDARSGHISRSISKKASRLFSKSKSACADLPSAKSFTSSDNGADPDFRSNFDAGNETARSEKVKRNKSLGAVKTMLRSRSMSKEVGCESELYEGIQVARKKSGGTLRKKFSKSSKKSRQHKTRSARLSQEEDAVSLDKESQQFNGMDEELRRVNEEFNIATKALIDSAATASRAASITKQMSRQSSRCASRSLSRCTSRASSLSLGSISVKKPKRQPGDVMDLQHKSKKQSGAGSSMPNKSKTEPKKESKTGHKTDENRHKTKNRHKSEPGGNKKRHRKHAGSSKKGNLQKV